MTTNQTASQDAEAPQSDPKSTDDPTQRIRDSAQQIWLAGLGAFAKVQREGTKVFESLVKDGQSMQEKTRQDAQNAFAQAQERMSSFANDFGTRATGQWSKIESIFEERVARALARLGMPSVAEVRTLRQRVVALEERLADIEKGKPQGKL
ncbi:MAG: phasin family protein [Burkholderiaceae bacterium]|jgi:poly(hydroxyalkanoate) granule-associated protein|nr:phasin family protein [Burkholderiaceae bacterium]